MDIYENLIKRLTDFIDIAADCIDVDNNYSINNYAISKLDIALKGFEDVAKCFYGFHGENDYKNSVVLCKRVANELKAYAKNISVHEIEYAFTHHPHLCGLLVVQQMLSNYAFNDNSLRIVVLDHKSCYGYHVFIDYEDVTEPDKRTINAIFNCGSTGYAIIGARTNKVKFHLKYSINSDPIIDKGIIEINNLHEGINIYSFVHNSFDELGSFTIKPMFEDKVFCEVYKSSGNKVGVLKE